MCRREIGKGREKEKEGEGEEREGDAMPAGIDARFHGELHPLAVSLEIEAAW